MYSLNESRDGVGSEVSAELRSITKGAAGEDKETRALDVMSRQVFSSQHMQIAPGELRWDSLVSTNWLQHYP